MAYIDIDIEDYLDDVDEDCLIEALESRGYTCNKQKGKEAKGEDIIWFEKSHLDNPHDVREILLAMTSLGHHVSDEDIFDKLKSMMK